MKLGGKVVVGHKGEIGRKGMGVVFKSHYIHYAIIKYFKKNVNTNNKQKNLKNPNK